MKPSSLSLLRIEHLLLQLLLFLIPSNLFLKHVYDQAYIHGVLIDYLLPKLYLTDIVILLLLLIYVLRIGNNISNSIHTRISTFHKQGYFSPDNLPKLFLSLIKNPETYVIILTTYLLLTSLSSLASLYAWLKLLELLLLLLYLYLNYTAKTLLKLSFVPLALCILFQSFISLYQYINQKSFFGYLFFGEIDLSKPGKIALTSLDGVLRVAPYGTTPHPNVLAGLFAWIVVIQWLYFQKISRSKLTIITCLTITSLYIIIFYLTQSWSSLLGLLVGFLILLFPSKKLFKVIISLILIINLLSILIINGNHYQADVLSENQSIIRRIDLLEAGLKTLSNHPFLGTGLNQSLVFMNQEAALNLPPNFLQPIHNLYILWIVEVGIAGLLLTLLLLKTAKTRFSFTSQKLAYVAPLTLILTVGLMDHYPLTLQTGQLMLVFSLGFLKSKSS